MTVGAIPPIGVPVSLQGANELTLAGPQQSFAKLVAENLETVNATMVRADRLLAEAALDGSRPPHQVMLALEEARLSFHLALQVRNKVLEAYQELMRMQV